MILLRADAKSDLNWQAQLDEAQSQKEPILWKLDFGDFFYPHDPLFFSSCSLAVEEFTKTVWPRFQGRTAGVVLYEGSSQFLDRVAFSEKSEALFEEWAGEFLNHSDLRQLFAANSLSELLHRLASFLPEEVKAICRIDAAKETNRAKLVQLLCKRRFEHLHVEVGGADWMVSQSTVGVSLPLDERLDAEAFAQLNAFFANLKDFRVIPEELLNEYWDGLDRILFLRSHTSEWGMRMLQGFVAAGGETESCEASITVNSFTNC